MVRDIPIQFARFEEPLSILDDLRPAAMAVVGSHGDPRKAPDEFSDLDLIYVFDTQRITVLTGRVIAEWHRAKDLVVTYLGVHQQFGHVVNLCYRDEPLHWVDIGLMDTNFAANYLVDSPMTIVRGEIHPSRLSHNPMNQLRQVAQKLAVAMMRRNQLYVALNTWRYLAWDHVRVAAERRNTGKGTPHPRFDPNELVSCDFGTVLQTVLDDIAERHPEIGRARQ